MAVPILVSFDRYAEVTFGLDAESAGSLPVANGVALVTEWLSNAQWGICYDQPTTSWGQCYSQPVTVWTDC